MTQTHTSKAKYLNLNVKYDKDDFSYLNQILTP